MRKFAKLYIASIMKRLCLLAILLASIFGICAAVSFDRPDFAYPADVVKDAVPRLNSPEPSVRFLAMMEIAKAKSDISEDSLLAMPAFIDSMARAEPRPDYKGLMYLYKAVVIRNISNVVYHDPEAAANDSDSLTADMSLWNERQFESAVSETLDRAIECLKKYLKRPLQDYSGIIACGEAGKPYYPFLRDFVYENCALLNMNEVEKYRKILIDSLEPGTPEWSRFVPADSPEELKRLVERYPEGLCGGGLLYRFFIYANYLDKKENRQWLLDRIEKYLEDNAPNAITPVLQNYYDCNTIPRLMISFPDMVAPGEDIKVVCTHSFIQKTGICLFRDVPALEKADNPEKIADYTIRVNRGIENVDTITIPGLAEGNYVLEPYVDKPSGDGNKYRLLVSDMVPVVAFDNNDATVAIADYATGRPMEGVSVKVVDKDRRLRIKTCRTDSHGLCRFKLPDKEWNRYNLLLSHPGSGDVMYDAPALYSTMRRESAPSRRGTVLTSRPLYHFGDTVGWSAVASVVAPDGKSESLSGKELTVILLNANNEDIDTISSLTDSYGRTAGNFVLPDEALAGMFGIRVMADDKFLCYGNFTVSDFNLSGFYVKDPDVSREGSEVTISSVAMRYSGAPLEGARVAIHLECDSHWTQQAREDDATGDTMDGQAICNADGRFEWSFDCSSLCQGDYAAKITVISPAGESVDSHADFRLAKEYSLSWADSDINFEMDSLVRLPVYALDIGGGKVCMPVTLKMENGAATVCREGRITDTGLAMEADGLEAGRYSITISPVDRQLCDSLASREICLYDIKRNKMPGGVALLIPSHVEDADADGVAEIVVGLDSPGTVFVFYNGTDSPQCETCDLPYGFSTIRIDLNTSDPKNEGMISLVRVKDGCVSREMVKVVFNRPPSVVLTVESMRDKTVPGGEEEWTFRLRKDGERMPGAMIATMYNAAIEKLAPSAWPHSLESVVGDRLKRSRFSLAYKANEPAYGWASGIRHSNPQRKWEFLLPSFTYCPERPVYLYGAASGNAMFPAAYGSVRKSVAFDGAVVEMAEAEEAAAVDAVIPSETDDFDFRSIDVMQALWLPDLTLDGNGYATVKFNMPNAVGQWTFRALAWNGNSAATQLVETVTTARPLMVETSAPRFLRVGDRVNVQATVLNATDSDISSTVCFELLDAATDSVIDSSRQTIELKGGAQLPVDFPIEAFPQYSSLRYRIKVMADGYSDGEQGLIPVIEAASTVVDSEIFFLDSENRNFKTVVPGSEGAEGNVTFQFCQNPIWQAVKALPGLYDGKPSTSLGAANSIFASSVARSLYDRYPQIRKALDAWKEENEGYALVDPLEKDGDLKLQALSLTPFVGSANAGTEQMERLALTFDNGVISRILSQSVDALLKMQNPDGGFFWGAWHKESSEWITLHVLETLGRLDSLDCEVDDKRMAEIVDKAFAYVDSKVRKDERSLYYALVYSLFPERKPSTLAGVQTLDATRQYMVGNWKKASVADKCLYALALYGLGNKAVAVDIMRSVGQFAVSAGSEGVAIPNVNCFRTYAQVLEALGRICPGDKLSDGIRQWLTFNSRNVGNVGTDDASALVAAILMNGCDLPSEWNGPEIAIDGHAMEIDSVESYTGELTKSIGVSAHPRLLTVGLPDGCRWAYGDIVSVGKKSLAEVKPSGNGHMRLTKRFLVERDGRWVESESFNSGERVKVQLLLVVDRPLEFVTIIDRRPAAFEVVDQMPGWIYADGASAYRVAGDRQTELYINWLPKGSYYLAYDVAATYCGTFASGVAAVQSQRAPEFTARSGATTVVVKKTE